ncbi:RNA-binding protein [Streptococcus iniae]|uniref:RNA-binding protein n=1 Tax=Streptococcus iniae TaxID=1346 RepID=A0A3L8GNG4_STRIN|nr:RNA-binding protein [Streptococcus iniae]AGM98352.1 hypothetical protein K710_0573 [Streptococcus iniae SF1]AHY15400.1 RNA-binding protein [Streptococcus iniae]AHY17269.1 RNA-binding protein [Streptococcus iniae]AJG25573.1 RNA-binding protein [Streptococcus iniae]APD31443.1 RNA-binding protein [Streptococcus iniae]
MTKQKDILQHFHPDEYPFIEKIKDVIQKVDQTYVLHVTDFLNPRQITIAKNVVAHSGLHCYSSTDSFQSEYGRLIIAPDYYQLDEADFEISLLEMRYHAKFNQLKHSQILGTLINELGIKRSLIGDILVEEGYAQLMVCQHLLSYFLGNITRIARTSVSLKEIDFSKQIIPKMQASMVDVTVSSLRIDRLMASILKLSRHQAIKLIASEKVTINYRKINKASDLLEVGDLVSVRGFGRFMLMADNGFTKNGKHKLTLSKTLHK